MDFVRPVAAVIPDAQGRILSTLVSVSGPLTLRSVAELSNVSPAQSSRVLKRLVALGMVERTDVVPAALFSLVREHVASQLITELAGVRQQVVKDIGKYARRLAPPPLNVSVFGSLIRGEARVDSDIDILIVRTMMTDANESLWSATRTEFELRVRRRTGNRPNVIEVYDTELPSLLHSGRPLWQEIVADSRLAFGSPFAAVG